MGRLTAGPRYHATMDLQTSIEAFLGGEPFAVAGASTNRSKYGNKVLRCYLQNHRRAIPIHPREREVEEQACFREIADVPEPIHGLSIITPPAITEGIVDAALEAGIRHFWIQPGAEHGEAIERAEALGANVIHGGPCLLVVLGFHE